MKYIKSKGGYYFKEYKNGKKKRISKEEFMKHKKYKNGKKKRISKKEFMKHTKSITKKPTKKITKKQKGGQNSRLCSYYNNDIQIGLWCPVLLIKDSNGKEFLYTYYPRRYWKILKTDIVDNHIYEKIDDREKLKQELEKLNKPGSLQNPERVTELSVWNIIKKKTRTN